MIFRLLKRIFRLRSPRWEEVRKKFVASNPECMACGTTTDLNVHHVLPYHIWPALELMPSNLITLCRQHHFVMGHFSDWDKYNPAVRNNAAAFRKKAGS